MIATMAYRHNPRYSSGWHGSDPRFVAGTGGEEFRGFNAVVQNSDYRIEGRACVLLLTLGDREWRSAWVEIGGRVWDQSGGKCH